MSVGERIAELRNARNISQGKLAQDLGVSRQAVSKWENDLSSPDTLHLIQIADLLETEVEYLATGRKPVYQPAPIVINLLDRSGEQSPKVLVREIKKPVIVKQKVRLNPLCWILFAGVWFTAGLLFGIAL